MSNLLYKYQNGSANVEIYEDGTRICETDDDKFDFEYPLNMDVKISNRCGIGCEMCHENSVPNGDLAPLENFEFLKNWVSGAEIALGGGSLTEHNYFEDILKLVKENNLIANCTFHQNEIINHFDEIKRYQEEGLIRGIGISFSKPNEELIKCVNQLDNVVFHVIAGLTSYKELDYLSKTFNKPKILILGYKKYTGRGDILYKKAHINIDKKIKILSHNVNWLFKNFKVVSFDNKAIEQLEIQKWITPEQWNDFYQGDEGTCSMYIDAVKGEFAMNSTSKTRYKLTSNVKEMFETIKKEKEENE